MGSTASRRLSPAGGGRRGQNGACRRTKSCSNGNVGGGAGDVSSGRHKVSNGNFKSFRVGENDDDKSSVQSDLTGGASRPPSPDKGLVGLSNLGNTCYLNSILQCICHTRELLQFALHEQPSHSGRLYKAFASLVHRVWTCQANSVANPGDLKACVAQFAPRFRGFSQQDSEEFLRYLLEGLHRDLNSVREPRQLPPIDYDELDSLSDTDKAERLWRRYLQLDNSVIVELFVGQLKSTLECSHCSHKSTTFDPFWDLALPIPGRSKTSLESCLRLFTAPETLDGNERPTCERCRCRRKCVKSFSIYRLPAVLVIHLKRFSGERFRTKLNTLVEYPHELKVHEFVDPKCPLQQCQHYSLYAVSEHSGTPYGGHYTAVVRHAVTGHWLRCNDTRVAETSAKSAISQEGYVLFYERSA